MIRASVGLLLFLISNAVYASPLLHFQLEGRRQGSDDPFASSVEVSLGDVVEYRLRLRLAAAGTTNQHVRTWTNYRPDIHGLNSLSASLVQDGNEGIQVDLSLPATPTGNTPSGSRRGWDRGTGADGGEPSLRPGTSWHNLLNVRPIQGPGVFTGAEEEDVFSGLFSVAEISGLSGQVTAEWATWSGGGAFDGYTFFITSPKRFDPDNSYAGTPTTEGGPDPIAQFEPLTLIAAHASPVPEPSTIVMAASALAVLFWFRKSLRRAT